MDKYNPVIYGNVKISEFQVGTPCMCCGETVILSDAEAHGVCIKLCEDCKEAIKFAKEMKKMCQKQKPIYDDGRYICPNCKRILICVTGPDDEGRLGLNFCINCGQAVKWE